MKKIIYGTVIFAVIYILSINGIKSNLFIDITSILIILYSLYHVLNERLPPFCLAKMVNLFNLFFFGFAPWLQFINGITLWDGKMIGTEQYQNLNIFIIILSVIFNITYDLYNKGNTTKYIVDNIDTCKNYFEIPNWRLIVLTILSSLVMLYIFYVNNFNPLLMFFRSNTDSVSRNISQIQALITINFIRPIPIIIWIYYMLCKNSKLLFSAIFAIFAIITVSPSAVARLMAAALYIPVILVIFSRLRKGHNFSVLFIVGLLAVFPFLNSFRRFDKDLKLSIGLDFNMFLEGHFDAYQNFVQAIATDFISYGNQLLGAVFFFVPRSMWPTKALGSGMELAQRGNYFYDNLAMPYLGEGYVNFGVIGSIIFVIILAIATKYLDSRFWYNRESNPRFVIQYLLFCGLSFFILRGDLMNGIAYTSGMSASVYLVSKFIKASNPVS